MEIKFPPNLLIITAGFFVSTFVFSLVLKRSFSTLTFSKETLLATLPVLAFLFLTASLMIVFALVAEKKIIALGALIAAILFILPLNFLPFLWRLVVAFASFLSFLFLCFQAQGTHEAYTGFSASHYRGVMRNFFLLFIFILGIALFSSTTQALRQQKFVIPEETIEPFVSQFVEAVGGMLRQQFGGRIPESQLAPLVEEQLVQLLSQAGLKLKLKGQPETFTQVTTRITKSLSTELAEIIIPFKVYIPFLVAGMAVLTLFTLTPFIVLIGSPVFFLVYRLLILVQMLKFEEVERKVKRLALA